MTRFYRKKVQVPMKPWVSGMDMESVSVSNADRLNGSPKTGDMIACDPCNTSDRWLVSKAYFDENYELIKD